MSEEQILSIKEVEKAVLIDVVGEDATVEKLFPEISSVTKNRFVMVWEAEGIIIPWEQGLTVRQAIIKWAKGEEQ